MTAPTSGGSPRAAALISATPDRFGYYRNPIASVPGLGLVYATKSSGGRTLELWSITAPPLPAVAIVIAPAPVGTSASNFVSGPPPTFAFIAFDEPIAAHYVTRFNGAPTVASIPAVGADYLTVNGSDSIFFREIQAFASGPADPVQVGYVKWDAANTTRFGAHSRSSQDLDYEDKYIATPIHIFSDFAFFRVRDSTNVTNFRAYSASIAIRVTQATESPGGNLVYLWGLGIVGVQPSSELPRWSRFAEVTFDKIVFGSASFLNTSNIYQGFHCNGAIMRISQVGGEFGPINIDSVPAVNLSSCGTRFRWTDFSRVPPLRVNASLVFVLSPSSIGGRSVFRVQAGSGGTRVTEEYFPRPVDAYGPLEAFGTSRGALIVQEGGYNLRFQVVLYNGVTGVRVVTNSTAVNTTFCPSAVVTGVHTYPHWDSPVIDHSSLFMSTPQGPKLFFVLSDNSDGFVSIPSTPFVPRYPLYPPVYGNFFMGSFNSSTSSVFSAPLASLKIPSIVVPFNITVGVSGTPTLFVLIGTTFYTAWPNDVRSLPIPIPTFI